MAQIPARDIYRDAVVDFRFYCGDMRNYANNSNELTAMGVPVTGRIQATHGIPALMAVDANPEQTWMLSGQDAVTIEALVSLDMRHLGSVASAEESTSMLLTGDWLLGFTVTPQAGQATDVSLFASFNGGNVGGSYVIHQKLSDADVQSIFKGAPLHVVLSALYIPSTSLTVTSCINGVVATDTATSVYHTMVDAPENVLFDSTTFSPVYLMRMWDDYISDAFALKSLYSETRRIFPFARFQPPIGSIRLTFPE